MSTAVLGHVDVLIIGAGVSGIGAAWRLRQRCPGHSYVILEARDDLGGTWDLFGYPGIRSDSDMYTFGYPFRPWLGERTLADGPSIRAYVAETASEAGIDRHIRFGQRVTSAAWSSGCGAMDRRRRDGSGPHARPVDVLVPVGLLRLQRLRAPHRPTFPDEQSFTGRIVHPQHWPEDLDWSGERVVVVGSGATAITLVPALAERAAHVSMLQRSATYVTALPQVDRVADALRRWLPARVAHRIIRERNVTLSQAFYQLCRHRPALAKRLLRHGLEQYLADTALLDEHFTPTYEPWDQRLCVMPDGDLLRVLADGRATVVTDRIEGGPRPHAHPPEEMFELVDGVVEIVPDGRRRRLDPGEPVTVPARSVHTFTNPGTEPARLKVTISPPNDFERTMRTLAGLARDGRLQGRGGRPAEPALMASLAMRSGYYEPPMPRLLWNLLQGALAPFGRRAADEALATTTERIPHPGSASVNSAEPTLGKTTHQRRDAEIRPSGVQ